ncbi:MAG: hypothetical protein QG625_285 [Cyanobacteriota bacterium erpe_2018_sw_39hr_WHONDRS-SW48-000098_B_bin.30]|jgi:hypothetical protein|nr:hypothetical protein [Cyanobacteriota bacterium erpe_2018_sw_39hr_WHONDRS-SW48-000098_B_bin.30]
MAVGDDRAVDETWVAGKRLYKKGVDMSIKEEEKH